MTDTPEYQAAAAEAVQQVQNPDVVADAGASLGQMATDRPAPLPAEADHDALMAEVRALTERLAAVEADAAGSRQAYRAAVAALGPPQIATYGRGIFDKLTSLRNAHPDLPNYFDSVIDAARPLATAAQNVLDGGGDVAAVTSAAESALPAVQKFIDRHPRIGGKPIDLSAIQSDIDDFEIQAAQAA